MGTYPLIDTTGITTPYVTTAMILETQDKYLCQYVEAFRKIDEMLYSGHRADDLDNMISDIIDPILEKVDES